MDVKKIRDALIGMLPDGVTVIESDLDLSFDHEPDIEKQRELGYTAARFTGYSTLTVKIVWYDPVKDERKAR